MLAGGFVYVEKGGVESIHFSIHVRDRMRDDEGAGTEIPVLSEKDFESGRAIHLVRVPCDPLFRRMLRIYGFDLEELQVTVRARGTFTGQLLYEQVHDLRIVTPDPREFPDAHLFPPHPPYTQIPLADEWCTTESVNIEIEPAGDRRIWGMVSVTNNVTQQVTLFTPQP